MDEIVLRVKFSRLSEDEQVEFNKRPLNLPNCSIWKEYTNSRKVLWPRSASTTTGAGRGCDTDQQPIIQVQVEGVMQTHSQPYRCR